MALSGKHEFGEINETRVTFVEKKVSRERLEFLKSLLEHNGFEVLIEELTPKTPEEETLFNLGVTDIVFNPTIWVYQRRLYTFDGRKITPSYWNQEDEDTSPQYWERTKKN